MPPFDVEDPSVKAKKKDAQPLPIDTQIDILSIPQQNLEVPLTFDVATALPIDYLAKLPNPAKGSPGWLDHALIWKVMCWAKQAGITYEQFWQWNRQKNETAARYIKWKKDWDACNYNIAHRTILAMLQRTYPNITETQVTKRFREQFKIPGIKMIDADFLQAEHISHWSIAKFTVLLAPMGRNKTGSVVDWLIDMCATQGLSVLWIAPRITLAQNTLQRLRDNGLYFANYKDFTKVQKQNGDLGKCNYLICSIQSLHYLDRNYNVIIADEWDTIASTFSKDCMTHQNRYVSNLAANWAIWMSQLNKAKKVIILDAFSTKLTWNFVEHFCQQANCDSLTAKTVYLGTMPLTVTKHKKKEQHVYEFVNLDRKPTQRQFIESKSFKGWIWEIIKAVREGKKIYVFTPYRQGDKGVETIAEMICKEMDWQEGVEIMWYHSLKDQEKRKLADVETLWANERLRCVVTNGAISVGVNFNLPDVFDQIFAFYCPVIGAVSSAQTGKPSHAIILKQNLLIEEHANGNFKDWETFNLFCELANVLLLPETINQILQENKRYLDELEGSVKCKFSWDLIEAIDRNIPDEGRAAWQNEDILRVLWDEARQLPSKLKTLNANPEHLISQLLVENQVVLNDAFERFPEKMQTTIPLKDIQAQFHFHNPPNDYRTQLCARMLEAYFEKKGISKRKCREENEEDTKAKRKKYMYDMDEDWAYLVSSAAHELSSDQKQVNYALAPDSDSNEDL
ncbi:hypothetical protein BDZ88DRAFT_438439 [Geranomyces variabilis]|nr:hypothetical protein BDZ88DRAFT_438439 [Geranomyces variabilis]